MASARTWRLLLLALLLAAAAVADEGAAAADDDGVDDGDDDDDDSDGDADGDECGSLDHRDGEGPSLEEYGVAALAEAAADPRSLVLGWRQFGDCLLFHRVVRRAKGFGRLHDVDVVMPRTNASITHVLARPAGDAGGALRAERRGGGVGQHWVHLKLRAPRGFGLHYEVRAYGQ